MKREGGEDEVGEVGHYLFGRGKEWIRCVFCFSGGRWWGGRDFTRLWIFFLAALTRMKPCAIAHLERG